MKPNKQQQKMLNKLEEIGEPKDVIVRGALTVMLADASRFIVKPLERGWS